MQGTADQKEKVTGRIGRDVEGIPHWINEGWLLIYYGLILCYNFGYEYIYIYIHIIHTFIHYISIVMYIIIYIYIHIYLHIFVRLDQLPHFPPLRPSRSYSANGTRTKTWIACKSAPPSFSVSVMPFRVNRWGCWASGNRVKYCSNIFQKPE